MMEFVLGTSLPVFIGITVIFVTHDMGVAVEIANGIFARLERGVRGRRQHHR